MSQQSLPYLPYQTNPVRIWSCFDNRLRLQRRAWLLITTGKAALSTVHTQISPQQRAEESRTSWLPLTKARLFVGRELHQVWTGAGRGAVVIDETQMRTGTASIILLARVGGCRGRGGGGRGRRNWDEKTEGNIESLDKTSRDYNSQLDENLYSVTLETLRLLFLVLCHYEKYVSQRRS